MKDFNIPKTLLLLAWIFTMGITMNAQVMVTRVAPGSTQPSGEGFFYTLPKIVLRVDLVLSKTEFTPGPLLSFSSDYLGIDDVIKTSNESYRLLNATVTPSSVVDAEQMYFVQLPLEKSKDERDIIFHLAENGALVSVNDEAGKYVMQPVENIDNTIYFVAGSNEFPYLARYNKKRQLDTIVRKITIDTVTINRFLFKTTWVDKSERERAEEAAQQIEKIREARFNLLTGYHEVNFGESIRYMDDQLVRMEQKHLELFLGKETTSVISQTVYYTPQSGEKQAQLWKAPNGQSVSIEMNTTNILKGLAESPAGGLNRVYYRVPAQSLVKINFEGQTHYQSMFLLNQLGAISTVPVSKSKLHFNPVTGNVMGTQKD